jgi:hypothetical protein
MIIQEMISDNLVRTYSDQGVLIHGGMPEGDYAEAIDPIDLHREYIETDIPIEEDEEEPSEAEEILDIILGENK